MLCHPNVHHRIHKSFPLSQMNPVSMYHPVYLRLIFISSHLCLGLHIVRYPSHFPTETLYTPILASVSATCPAHLILRDLILTVSAGSALPSSCYVAGRLRCVCAPLSLSISSNKYLFCRRHKQGVARERRDTVGLARRCAHVFSSACDRVFVFSSVAPGIHRDGASS
jgi:hypothetical protein